MDFATYLATQPTLTDKTTSGLLVDQYGNLLVNVVSGGGSNASVGANGTTAPTSSTEISGVYNAAGTVVTNGQISPLQTDANGILQVGLQNGFKAAITPYQFQYVSVEPWTIFNDPFSGGTLDTTVRWTTQLSGGGTVPQSGGFVSPTAGTTNGAYAVMYTQPSFSPAGASFLVGAETVQMETSAVSGKFYFWGFGVVPATPTATVPITNGVGWQRNANGTLQGVVYSNGALVASTTVTYPTDGYQHTYGILIRSNLVLFYIDGFDASHVVGQIIQYIPATFIFPKVYMVINSTATAGTPVFNIGASVVGDTAANGISIRDATYGWRGVTVGANGALLTEASAVYNSTAPTLSNGAIAPLQSDVNGNLFVNLATLLYGEDATNGVLGTVRKYTLNATYSRLPFYAIGAATAVAKSTAGVLASAYCDNLSASTAYFQVYNQAGGTPTGTPIFVKSVSSNGGLILDDTFLGPNGMYCSAGIVTALSSTSGSYTAVTTANLGGTYL